LLIIGGVIVSLAIFNGLYPAITSSSSAISDATNKVNDRIESRIEIIQVSHSDAEIFVWIKNTGASTIDGIERSDLFYGPEDNFSRINYGGVVTPDWSYSIEGGFSTWDPMNTCKFTIELPGVLTTGSYMVKFVIPNGIYDSTTFSVQ